MAKLHLSYSARFLTLLLLLNCSSLRVQGYGYGSNTYLQALKSSILFFEGQRSGRLPASQRVTWRADSALHDGFAQGVDLVGGYYDAGDNVKFGLPMAFTITMLSWSVIEYGSHIEAAGELGHALEAIKWGTDYLLKAHPEPNLLWGEVGDGDTDHYCWQRPEEMTTSRQAYKIDTNNPGSDLAAETAAAMAAASMVFRSFNREYAEVLVQHAKQLFSFADNYRGRYDSSISVARNYYQSESGYNDELLWASMWLYEATSERPYLHYAIENAHNLGGVGWKMTEFSWDVKYAGLQVLASKIFLQHGARDPEVDALQIYQPQAEYFMCACLQKNYGKNVARTPGGLLYTRAWNNMQYVSSASFLMTVYSDYLTSSRRNLHCPAGYVQPSELLGMAKSQVDYILGDNPRGTSYIVGVGTNYPQRIHHRAASIVSYKIDRRFVACREGYQTWYSSSRSDPNVHVGALVGGPDENDDYADDRENFDQSEPATYNNGPIIGVLARLFGGRTESFGELFPATHSAAPVSTHSHSHVDDLVITQAMTSSWEYKGKTFYRYKVTLTNNTPHLLRHLQLSVKNLHGPLWGLTEMESSGLYTFPEWIEALKSGQALEFVYIQAAPEAQVSVSVASFT